MTKYIASILLAMLVTYILLSIILPLLKKLKMGQNILSYVSEHKDKQGTPTMGGIAFVLSIAIVTFAMVGFDNVVISVAVAVIVGYGIIGCIDDALKISRHQNGGLLPYQKVIAQLGIAVTVALFACNQPPIGSQLYAIVGAGSWDIGWWAIPLIIFIFIACTNGVNLTDGLDGLATTTTICYLVGIVAVMAVQLQYLDSIGDTLTYSLYLDLLVLACVSIGALIAFLIFNCYPAKVFMGDCGSLALGGLVACIAIFSRLSLLIPIIGVMFVVSCLSVIVQVGYYKVTKGKRILLMAPYHHHLQHKGYSETRIAVMYGVVTLVMSMLILLGGVYG